MAKNVSQESIQYVNDFFKVSNAINDYLIKTSPRDSFWGARTCTTIVIINQYDEEKTYDLPAVAELTGTSQQTVRNFFSVYCCVDNCYPLLVGQEVNTGWVTVADKIFVEFHHPAERHRTTSFGIEALAELFEVTKQDQDWSFEHLVQEELSS